MDLIKGINDLWDDKKEEIDKKLKNWANVLKVGDESLVLAKKEFHQWGVLRAYISKSDLNSESTANFSLRFYGEKVADIKVKVKEINKDKKTILRLKGYEKNKGKDNKLKIGFEDGDYPWRGYEAKRFRRHFLKLAKRKDIPNNLHSPEHSVESKFIKEMCKGSTKFGLDKLRMNPVLIAKKFPLQIPLPISASSGTPIYSNGHVDILARRNGRLSVWELKGPGVYGTPATQALIYAYTILLILRKSKYKNEWYRLFGFMDKKIPSKLTIEAVVAITKDQCEGFKKEKLKLEKENKLPLIVGKDRIELYVVYYKEEHNSINIEKNPFVK